MVIPPTDGSIVIDQSVRVSHLDWLRALIVFMLIPYHTATIFFGVPWLINNPLSSLTALAFGQILDQFQMPLLFTIAGAATWFSLGGRTGKQYFIERLGRLFIPIVFGMLILTPPMYYISTLYHNQGWLYDNSLFIWYRTYLKTTLFPWQKDWASGVFWFIWYLFIYSVVLLPLLLFLRKHAHNNAWARFGKLFEKRRMATLFLLAILPVLVQVYPTPNFS